jgi:hypothetical protein
LTCFNGLYAVGFFAGINPVLKSTLKNTDAIVESNSGEPDDSLFLHSRFNDK